MEAEYILSLRDEDDSNLQLLHRHRHEDNTVKELYN